MHDNKQIVTRFWDALAARDWDGMRALLTADAHYTDVGTPGPGGRGPEGVIRRLRIGIEPLESYTHLPGTNMVAEGDLVMTEHTERWTFHTGEVIDHSIRFGHRVVRWEDLSLARLLQHLQHHGQRTGVVARADQERGDIGRAPASLVRVAIAQALHT